MSMKKIILCMLIGGVLLISAACGNVRAERTETSGVPSAVSGSTVKESAAEESAAKESAVPTTDSRSENEKETEPPKRMVCLEGKVFVDTGELSLEKWCGTKDFTFDSTTKKGKTPVKNGQTNFGRGYGGQYGARENRIDILIDETWHIFAYHENDFDGVSMEVVKNDENSADVRFSNTTDLRVQYGDAFILERFDKEEKQWFYMPYVSDDIAFHDIAYEVPQKGERVWETDWKNIYGTLDTGKYRIVKEVTDFRKTGDYTVYTLMAEFNVDA